MLAKQSMLRRWKCANNSDIADHDTLQYYRQIPEHMLNTRMGKIDTQKHKFIKWVENSHIQSCMIERTAGSYNPPRV